MLQTPEEWIERLGLRPLEDEGGFFRETFRSDETFTPECLPARYGAPRTHYTSIYYLITPTCYSVLHRLKTDEIFHFHAGDPVFMLQLFETGTGRTVRIGNSGAEGIEPQMHVPRRVWQGMRLEAGGKFALLGATVAPGYERADCEIGERSKLVKSYPEFKFQIMNLTRPA